MLGESSNDLATLCKSAKINKWSPHKPVHSSKLFDLNDADFGITDKTFKLIVPSYTRLEDLCRDVIIRTPSYTYEKPKGGSSSPYRLGDFKEYNSVINRGRNYNNAKVDVSSTSGKMNMYYYTREDHASGSYLNLWDFYVFNSCYFGVAVIDRQGNVGARLNKNMQTFGLKPNSDMDYYIEVSEYLEDTGNVFVAYVLTEKADTLRPSDYPTWGS